ncbi:MAG: peptide MFS transporter [Acidobacteria bacterium]|nr:peptide MFS transporter [Acidobacteriota bacterium]
MTETPGTTEKKSPWREIVEPFVNLVQAPMALWAANLSYCLEGLAYFGTLALLAIYYNDFLGFDDHAADWMVGVLTGGITLGMLFLGSIPDRWGVRRALVAAMAFVLVGRALLAAGPTFLPWFGGATSPLFLVSLAGILCVVVGWGMYQPAIFSAVKHFTDEKTAAMGFAMLYAVNNLGGFLPGLLSPRVRAATNAFFEAHAPTAGPGPRGEIHYGILGVYWVYVALTVVGLLVVALLLNRRAVERARRILAGDSAAGAPPAAEGTGRPRRTLGEYLRQHPLRDGKFTFFVFVLIPVQTLFAHNWLTLPQYVDRCFGQGVRDNMEFFVNFSPLLIFVLTPLVAALTTKVPVYRMMMLGTLVMAAPTFLLSLGTNVYLLVAYIVIMSVGEAMWSPRFLQFITQIAPAGRTGEYVGVGQFPWFLTKILTSLYAGFFLARFVPIDGLRHPQTLWLVYGGVAMITPVALFLARRRVSGKLEEKG